MYSTYFMIPKAVYFFCIFPALLVIIATIIFNIIYLKKKGTYYYIYTLNYVCNVASMLLCLLLLPLLFGYSIAMLVIIKAGLFADVSLLLIMLLIFLPIVPLITLIVVCIKFVRNLKYKEILEERKSNLENNMEVSDNLNEFVEA